MEEKCTHWDYRLKQGCENPRGNYPYPLDHYCEFHARQSMPTPERPIIPPFNDQRDTLATAREPQPVNTRGLLFQYLLRENIDPLLFSW